MSEQKPSPSRPLRVAILGCGFWSRYQVAGWQEVPGVQVVAAWNRTRAKADALAADRQIPRVCDTPEELLDRERPDVVDIITDVDTHAKFSQMAIERGFPVICQKPMAPTYDAAAGMQAAAQRHGVPLFIHENWRWQAPIRAFKAALAAAGPLYRARIDFANGFPVFANQPFLRELEQFILTDIGSHILDTARFLFGEVETLYCQTRRMHADIKGEDVATVMMRMNDITVTCNMSYVENFYEHDRFPETFVFAEGGLGTVELGPDFWLRITTRHGTSARRVVPPFYPWADPRYGVVHSSIVACNENLAAALRGEAAAETTGQDNLKTVRLVHAAYASASSGRVIHVGDDSCNA
jgi:predicted dehydrogenase